jgi:hypothetical protein
MVNGHVLMKQPLTLPSFALIAETSRPKHHEMAFSSNFWKRGHHNRETTSSLIQLRALQLRILTTVVPLQHYNAQLSLAESINDCFLLDSADDCFFILDT